MTLLLQESLSQLRQPLFAPDRGDSPIGIGSQKTHDAVQDALQSPGNTVDRQKEEMPLELVAHIDELVQKADIPEPSKKGGVRIGLEQAKPLAAAIRLCMLHGYNPSLVAEKTGRQISNLKVTLSTLEVEVMAQHDSTALQELSKRICAPEVDDEDTIPMRVALLRLKRMELQKHRLFHKELVQFGLEGIQNSDAETRLRGMNLTELLPEDLAELYEDEFPPKENDASTFPAQQQATPAPGVEGVQEAAETEEDIPALFIETEESHIASVQDDASTEQPHQPQAAETPARQIESIESEKLELLEKITHQTQQAMAVLLQSNSSGVEKLGALLALASHAELLEELGRNTQGYRTLIERALQNVHMGPADAAAQAAPASSSSSGGSSVEVRPNGVISIRLPGVTDPSIELQEDADAEGI